MTDRLKVLLVNKFFFPNAGAETVFFLTRDLLKERGHDVIDFAMHDERNVPSPYASYFARHRSYDGGRSALVKGRDALASVYSWEARLALRRLVRDHRPDVAHLHNVYHQLSLSIIDELAEQGIPMVLTLHDYKPVCPSYDLFTEGAPCRRCVDGSPFHAIAHRCVKGSRPASAIAAVEACLARARSTYDRVDAVISPSSFLASLVAGRSFRSSRVRVVPNPVEAGAVPDSDHASRGTFVYAGQLTTRKGVETMAAAAQRLEGPAEIDVYGGGPLSARLKDGTASMRMHGHVDRDLVRARLARARAVIVPSIWEENSPMIVLEAGAAATPVIASAVGGIPELVTHERTGLLVAPGCADALASAMTRLVQDGALARELGVAAREHVKTHHSTEQHISRVLAIYRELTGERRKGQTVVSAQP